MRSPVACSIFQQSILLCQLPIVPATALWMPKVVEGEIAGANCREMEMSSQLFHMKEDDGTLRDLGRT